MSYDNLAGFEHEKLDGGLSVAAASGAPKILILGAADKGPSETPWVVGRTQEAAVLFGSSGNLTRGMYEVKTGGAENVVLFRIGATAAVLDGIGVDASIGGVKITTAVKDDTAAEQYSMYWDNTSADQRLVVKNVSSDTIVFDRNYDEPVADVDLGEIYVSGSPVDGEGADIGTASTLLTLKAVADAGTFDVTLVAGTDGTTLSRMQVYESLFESYLLLENEDFDQVVPMDVYLDDKNVVDGFTFSASPGASYPVQGTDDDILLYFYAEEYQGVWYFWWREAAASGNPDVYPSVTYATETPSGVDLTTTAFWEVNFAYQLANFCYTVSKEFNECFGAISVRPPVSVGLRDVNVWLGTLPTYTVESDGSSVIESGNDGSGLMGNKFMAGKYGFRSNVAYGGLIATEEGFIGGTELEDSGGHVIDIGQYIDVVGQWLRVYNRFDTSQFGYITGFAPTYAGLVSTLDPKNAPTNVLVGNSTLPFRVSNTKLNDLAGLGFVFCQPKSKGNVIADAPTASRPDSDWTRRSTGRIVKLVIDALRAAGDPFLGFAGGSPQRAALETALEGEIQKLKKAGYIIRHVMSITATTAQRVAGEATVELEVVVPLELRKLKLKIALRAV